MIWNPPSQYKPTPLFKLLNRKWIHIRGQQYFLLIFCYLVFKQNETVYFKQSVFCIGILFMGGSIRDLLTSPDLLFFKCLFSNEQIKNILDSLETMEKSKADEFREDFGLPSIVNLLPIPKPYVTDFGNSLTPLGWKVYFIIYQGDCLYQELKEIR